MRRFLAVSAGLMLALSVEGVVQADLTVVEAGFTVTDLGPGVGPRALGLFLRPHLLDGAPRRGWWHAYRGTSLALGQRAPGRFEEEIDVLDVGSVFIVV